MSRWYFVVGCVKKQRGPFIKNSLQFRARLRKKPSRLVFRSINPFNRLAYGPLVNCLRLKVVTCYSPRLVTSEWLILSRRESHPLYISTLLGRSDNGPVPSSPGFLPEFFVKPYLTSYVISLLYKL